MTVWVSVGFAVLAGLALQSSPAFALQWACLWLGFALFYKNARCRFFSFLPKPAPDALHDLGFAKNELEAATLAPWYLLPLAGILWALIAPAALVADDPPLVAFGVGIFVVLTFLAVWSWQTNKTSSRIATLLVRTPPPGLLRIQGRIVSPSSALRLHRWWFDSSEFHQGGVPSQLGKSKGGEETPTSSTYGFRQERRRDFQVESSDGRFVVDVANAVWAAPTQKLSSAPSVDFLSVKPTRQPAVLDYLRNARAWEQEELGAGSNVIVLGKRQGGGDTHLGASAHQRLLVFGTDESEEPARVLTRALRRRQGLIVGQLLLASVALAACVL